MSSGRACRTVGNPSSSNLRFSMARRSEDGSNPWCLPLIRVHLRPFAVLFFFFGCGSAALGLFVARMNSSWKEKGRPTTKAKEEKRRLRTEVTVIEVSGQSHCRSTNDLLTRCSNGPEPCPQRLASRKFWCQGTQRRVPVKLAGATVYPLKTPSGKRSSIRPRP